MSKKTPTPGDERRNFKTQVQEMEWDARYWKAQYEFMSYKMATYEVSKKYAEFISALDKPAETEHTITPADLEANPELVGQVEVGEKIGIPAEEDLAGIETGGFIK